MARKAPPDILNDQQIRFCEEYIIDFNGTKAAIRAGYSEKTAASQASQLLTKLNIQNKIAKLIEKRSKRTEITQDKVLSEIAKLAFSDMNNYAQWGKDGVTLKDSSELSPEQTAAVSEVSESTTKDGGTIKFKLHDKKGSLELLGKHLGIFQDAVPTDLNIKVTISGVNDTETKGA